MFLSLQVAGLLLFVFTTQVQLHQTLLNDGPISMYFLALLLQYRQLLLYKILPQQDPGVQVTGNTLCMVRSCSLLPFLCAGPLSPSGPWFPWRLNTIHLNKSRTANSHFREEEIIAAAQIPIRVYVSPKELHLSMTAQCTGVTSISGVQIPSG